MKYLSLWLLMLTTLMGQAQAADPLQLPAVQRDRAEQAIILDVSRAGERLVAVGERGIALYSDDQGQSWQQAAVPVSVMLTALFFVDDQQGWAVGHGGVVLVSRDGGQSWQKQLDGNRINELQLADVQQRLATAEQQLAQLESLVEQDPSREAELEEAQYQLEELQMALDDAELAQEEGPGIPLLDLWFANQQQGFVVGAYGLILRTEDGGQSWQPWQRYLDNPDRNHYNAITALDENTLILAGEAGLLLRSEDGGQSWLRLDPPYEGSYFGLVAAEQQVYLLGLRGNAFSSDDQGDSWQALELDNALTLAGGHYVDGQLLLVGNSGLFVEQSQQQWQEQVLDDRQSRSAVTAVPGYWILAGEGGLSRRPRAQP